MESQLVYISIVEVTRSGLFLAAVAALLIFGILNAQRLPKAAWVVAGVLTVPVLALALLAAGFLSLIRYDTARQQTAFAVHQVSADTAASPLPAEREPGTAAATPRPEWVDRPPGFDSARGVYQRVLAIGPYTSSDECYQAASTAVAEAVRKYSQQLPGAVDMNQSPLAPDYVEQHVVRGQWLEPITASFGPMVQLHVLLEFDDQARAKIRRASEDFRRRERLWYAAAGGSLLLGALGLLHGGLYAATRHQAKSRDLRAST